MSDFVFMMTIKSFIFSCQSKVAPVACSNGTYAGIGQSTCSACTTGYYCPNTKTVAPVPCPSGTYSNDTGASFCQLCQAGHKCPNASITPMSCETGTYSKAGSGECTICPAGTRYCKQRNIFSPDKLIFLFLVYFF